MKIVMALGGNALQKNAKDTSPESQLDSCKRTAESVVDLIEEGHTIAIVHGNGPQVGSILYSMESAKKFDESNVVYSLDICGAFTQGYIGYHLQKSIQDELLKRSIRKKAGTIITQILVDKNDPGFKNPSKPIGLFYSKEEALKIEENKGYIMKEDAGRGYRRVVASPKPVDIIEKDIIEDLVESGDITISCGGGGIPVIEENGRIKGVEAVIDKDYAAEKLAEIIDADALLILTSIDKVAVNYRKPNEKFLDLLHTNEIDTFVKENQFLPGSMLPKIEACRKFTQYKDNKIAIIASLYKAKEALYGKSGTQIVK